MKKATAIGIGVTIFLRFGSLKKEKEIVRIRFIGARLRGQWLLDLASKREGVSIPTICDIDELMIDRTLKLLKRDNKETPSIYKTQDFRFIERGST